VIVTPTSLPEVLVVEPTVFGDGRGWFLEAWHAERYAALGIGDAFVQDNVSYSARGVLRGLHLQHPHEQAKLIQVLDGAVFDVAVDVRRGSPRFGRWASVELSSANRRQLYVPRGFAHGFLVTSEHALVSYKASATYRPDAELAIRWDDPALAIAWPLAGPPTVSPRDAAAPPLADVPPERLPRLERSVAGPGAAAEAIGAG
jgi:dTDP-4-dehydrorhamnose 3,5-epimerase